MSLLMVGQSANAQTPTSTDEVGVKGEVCPWIQLTAVDSATGDTDVNVDNPVVDPDLFDQRDTNPETAVSLVVHDPGIEVARDPATNDLDAYHYLRTETNANDGYYINVSYDHPLWRLDHSSSTPVYVAGAAGTEDEIPDTHTGTVVSPEPYAWDGTDGLAFSMLEVSGYSTVDAKWGNGDDYAAFSTTPEQLHRKPGYQNTPDYVQMKYRLGTDRYQKTGIYKNVVTFTAVAVLETGEYGDAVSSDCIYPAPPLVDQD